MPAYVSPRGVAVQTSERAASAIGYVPAKAASEAKAPAKPSEKPSKKSKK